MILICDNPVVLHISSNLIFAKGLNILRLIAFYSRKDCT